MLRATAMNNAKNALRSLVLLATLFAGTAAMGQQMSMETLVDPGHAASRSWVDIDNDGKDDYCVLTGSSAATLECYRSTGSGFAFSGRSALALTAVRLSRVKLAPQFGQCIGSARRS